MSNISTTGPGINEASNPYAGLQSVRTGYASTTDPSNGLLWVPPVGTTATAASWYPSVRHELESAELVDGKIEIIKRCISNPTFTYSNGLTSPDAVIKEIYGVLDGQIVLERTIHGKVVPEQIIEESFEFDENV